MATYILVPGGWSGGWQVRAVATHLRVDGHQVFTPTLTGLGERVHLAHPDVTLETHIQDIVNVIRFEDLSDVILVGYSYSGMVTTAVADRLPERLAHLIYVDAYVPNDGQSLADILGPQVMTMLREFADQYGDGWRLLHNPPDAPFRTDQPLNAAFQAIHLRDPRALTIPRTFISVPRIKIPPIRLWHRLRTLPRMPKPILPGAITNFPPAMCRGRQCRKRGHVCSTRAPSRRQALGNLPEQEPPLHCTFVESP
jgi:pimeloyl-ACP methyl ester carboxylesterase